jgi:hypothetical protein
VGVERENQIEIRRRRDLDGIPQAGGQSIKSGADKDLTQRLWSEMRSGLPEINIATRIDFARTNKWQTNFPADKQHAKEKTGIHLIGIPVF